ncbi:MAG: hypothetical protein IKL31_02180, partial [Ruminococcus sp.]|nr:hypothetical protein [Ruminococcus sp.]
MKTKYFEYSKPGSREKYTEIEYSAPVEHPRPAKMNSTVAENEQHRRSSCTLTSLNLYDTIIM